MQLTRYTEDADDCTTTLDHTGMSLVMDDPEGDARKAKESALKGDLPGVVFWLQMPGVRDGR